MIGTVKSDFSRFALTRTLRRCQRSSNTPAKGPMKEYGSSKMANAAATRTASGWREQHERRERGLQQSVTELTGESDAVEAAEIVARKNRPKGAVSRVRGVLNSHGERLRVP